MQAPPQDPFPPTYLTRCQLVLADALITDGSLLLEGERIGEVCPQQRPASAREIDLAGAIVMPGMIDLHCDAVESIAEPRPGAFLPFAHAAAQIDRISAACGVTTMYNAISFAGEELGLRRDMAGARLVEALAAFRPHALVDQRVHCRLEVTCADALPQLVGFLQREICQLVSYMDHSPGQGQFQDEANFRNYMATRYGYDDATITELIRSKQQAPAETAARAQQLAAAARAAGVPLAGHDADSPAHVAEMTRLGAVLAEFPMNPAAARAAVAAGLAQSVGSVNVLRGGSQRTGMSAREVIGAGLADCLCSDYVPSTLLPAVFLLARELDQSLPWATRLVTANPARAMGLGDRGRLEAGLRADLIAVKEVAGQPLVQATWYGGRPVLAADSWLLAQLPVPSAPGVC